jgi:hypothetical protein
MERTNYWIDVLLFISFLVVAVTAIIMAYIVPYVPGSSTATFLGASRGDWVGWHKYFGWAMIVLIIIHLLLHLKWIKVMTISLFTRQQ